MTETEQLSDPYKYLSKATKLYDKYTMNDILQKSNITPGKNYTYQEISNAVSKVTQGKKPVIKCLWNFMANILELERITLFFDKSLNLIDPLKNYYPGKCSPDLPILYKNYSKKSDYQSQLVPYEDPFDKYPTLREDNNGYYLFIQKAKPLQCFGPDSSSCLQPKYPWGIQDSSKYSDTEVDFRSVWHNQGQCSTYFKGKFDSEFKFYKKSFELLDKYNIDVILRQVNITSGKNYTYQEISEAVSKKINGKKPIVICSHEYNGRGFNEVLSGIAIFMDKNLDPIDVCEKSKKIKIISRKDNNSTGMKRHLLTAHSKAYEEVYGNSTSIQKSVSSAQKKLTVF
ncbi:hypothetical protein KQX54_008719 [Cotesia glomerata]|uniref:Uncharacterized protein n=1 Tax=Cotesia glomerata TaxID=32391 RepID=A0AAV7IFL5_COTGL|nr:hypothetical protein KQX54_008719 [Cotesia glomerata]